MVRVTLVPRVPKVRARWRALPGGRRMRFCGGRQEIPQDVVSAANRINRAARFANDAVRLRPTASCGV